MAEIKKGSFTLPGEAGFESLTLKMAEKVDNEIDWYTKVTEKALNWLEPSC
mgnify:CR=1 FL=1